MKRLYDVVLLDLDGTIVKSDPGIVASVKKMLAEVGYEMPAGFDYTQFIGPPIFASIKKFTDLSDEQAQECLAIYRKYYNAGEILNVSVFPGMRELIETLKESGLQVCVATSKPQPMAEVVLDHVGLTPLLDCISAADTSDKKSNKDELILRALDACGAPVERAVMVGDTRFDAEGARKTGVDFIGVLYGYGTRESMEEQGGCCFVERVSDLLPLLLAEE